MLARIVLVLCLAALARSAAFPFVFNNINPQCFKYNVMCPRNYEPVCGTDGVTYGNECMLCLKNKEDKTNISISKMGECRAHFIWDLT
ncbi:trypsin inhibitor ClTI-1-like [Danio rerio]|uniref:Trypsin inhibitor ClTI-1-like n=1 Tax=Danio rerio TaxID=7955 RepID=A0AC58H759_DANRE|nr:trypsin inhibitor ClTI-1-like [Danio rerio]|eukprot:XP_021336806.1 trypsin inhibitor ClTI-1-like [Danio rerio]